MRISRAGFKTNRERSTASGEQNNVSSWRCGFEMIVGKLLRSRVRYGTAKKLNTMSFPALPRVSSRKASNLFVEENRYTCSVKPNPSASFTRSYYSRSQKPECDAKESPKTNFGQYHTSLSLESLSHGPKAMNRISTRRNTIGEPHRKAILSRTSQSQRQRGRCDVSTEFNVNDVLSWLTLVDWDWERASFEANIGWTPGDQCLSTKVRPARRKRPCSGTTRGCSLIDPIPFPQTSGAFRYGVAVIAGMVVLIDRRGCNGRAFCAHRMSAISGLII